MKIGIIGAGFTGLAAAHALQKQNHDITIIEKDGNPGGLAIGYKEKNWKWSLEKHYHHWFTNDTFVLDLAKEINFEVLIKRPKTSVFIDGSNYQLDSPSALLTFSKLTLIERLRMGASLAFLKFNPFWKPLEKINASTFLPKIMGKHGYELLWQPQLVNKMGKFATVVSLVWFWTRIYKRTPQLAYPKGGFLSFAEALVSTIEKKGGKVLYNSEILKIVDDKKTNVIFKNNKGEEETYEFDKIIVTLPSYLFLKITPQLPDTYRNSLVKLQGLGATNMVLRLKKQLIKDGTYWLSICETPSPVMVVVEHTNLMDIANYNNEHLVYVGNYPSTDSEKYLASDEELLKMYDPLLSRINSKYKEYLIDYRVFRTPFAQPIIPTNYSKIIPKFKTPLPNVFLANIEQVYPWDRGTNYAVELGQKIADISTA